MAVYEPDSSATAVILCKLTDISYKWGIESFRLVSEYKVKIKVLKPEGTSYADVIIPEGGFNSVAVAMLIQNIRSLIAAK